MSRIFFWATDLSPCPFENKDELTEQVVPLRERMMVAVL